MQEHGKTTGHESGSLDEEFKKRKEKRAQAAYASEREREERLKDRPTQEWEKERTTEEQIAALMEVEQKMAYQPPKEAPKTAEKQPVNKLEGVKVPPRKPKTPKASAKAQKVTPKAPVVDTAKVKQESDQDRDYRLYYSEVKDDYVSGRSVQQFNILKARFESFDASIGHKVGSKAWVDALTTKFDGIRWIKPYLIEEGKAEDPQQEETKVEAATEEPESYTLQNSVGDGGVNFKEDVGYIQELLLELGVLSESGFQEENGAAMHSPKVVEQGDMPKTIAAIELFQREVLHWTNIDGKVDAADSKTLTALESVGMDYDYVKARIAMYPSVKARKEKAAQEKEEAQEIQMAQEVTQNRLTPYAQLIAEEIPDLYKVVMSLVEFNKLFRPNFGDKIRAAESKEEKEALVDQGHEVYEQFQNEAKGKVRQRLKEKYFIDFINGKYDLNRQAMVDQYGAEEIQKNKDKYIALRTRAKGLFTDPILDKHIFDGQGGYGEKLERFLTEKSKEKVDASLLPIQAYNPQAFTTMLGWFIKDDNQVPSSGELSFKILLSGRYMIFKLTIKGGASIKVGVRDNRSFAVNLSWTLGGEAGVDTKLGKASIGYDYEGNIALFNELNGRYDSLKQFAAFFHNSLTRFCMETNTNPALIGLDPDSAYWKANKHELAKAYEQEDIETHKGYMKGETMAGSSGEASVTHKTIKRDEYKGGEVGEAPERTNRPSETKTRKTIALEFTHGSNISMSVEYTSDEKDQPLFIDFNVSYKKERSTRKEEGEEKEKAIAQMILELRGNPENGILGNIRKISPKLIKIITPEGVKGGLVKKDSLKADAKFRVTYSDRDWHLSYVRFSRTRGEVKEMDTPLGFELEGSRTQGMLEILGDTHIGYISKLYNNMVFEQTATTERDRMSASLQSTKAQRDAEEDEMEDMKLLNKTWKGQPMPKSSDWETYRDAHEDGIKRIMDNFAKGVEEALAECNEETWSDANVMGVPLRTYFGEYRIAENSLVIRDIIKGKSTEEEIKLFEQHVLFNKYKEFLVNEKQIDL